MNITDRQKLLRLIVKDILIDDETIRIRHSIPVTKFKVPTGSGGNTKIPSYLLRPRGLESAIEQCSA